MKDAILQIIQDRAANCDASKLQKAGVYMHPNIPAEVCSRAIETFGAGAAAGDVLLFISYGPFKPGKRGFLLTDNAIYMRGLDGALPSHRDFHQITTVDFKSTFWTSQLILNGNYVGISIEPVALKFLADVLVHITRAIKTKLIVSDVPDRLRELKKLLTEGLITEKEFSEIRARYLSQL